MDNYDPDMVCMGRKAKQSVTLFLQTWNYTGELTVVVGGNCRGFTVIESAISNAYDRLYEAADEKGELPRVVLKDVLGDGLICEDDEESGEDWLKDLVIGARITSIVDDGTWLPKKRKRSSGKNTSQLEESK